MGARRGKWGLRIKERPRGGFFFCGAKVGAGREGKRKQGARTTRPSRVGKAIFAVTLPALHAGTRSLRLEAIFPRGGVKCWRPPRALVSMRAFPSSF